MELRILEHFSPTCFDTLNWNFAYYFIFSSPEPKSRVSYCHSVPSVVCKLFTFSTSSPEPLDGFWWNMVRMKYSWFLTSVVVFQSDPPRGRSRVGPKMVTGGPLLQETSSSDWKATATNQMDSNDLEACGKMFIFGSIPKSNFWRVFDVFLDLVIFAYFNAISIDFYEVKGFICIYCA